MLVKLELVLAALCITLLKVVEQLQCIMPGEVGGLDHNISYGTAAAAAAAAEPDRC
jgi:hypothetical protein